MNMYLDLHTHSTCSDGTLSPSELISHAKALSLGAIALTDHDSIAGIPAARKAADTAGIELVPGIELCCYHRFEFHLLGYFFDPEQEDLRRMLEGLRVSRWQRNMAMIEKLAGLGYDISPADFSDCPSQTLTRAHIGRLLAQKGYVKDISSAFATLIGSGKKGYVPREKLSFPHALDVLHKAGGKAYLAHLCKLPIKSKEEIFAFITELQSLGLDGIEGYYSEYSDDFEAFCLESAAKLGLGVSGGSDFHGAIRARELSYIQDGKRLSYKILAEMRRHESAKGIKA